MALEKVCAVVESGHSVLVLSEAGSGVDDLAAAVHDRLEGGFLCASEIYKGSTKQFFKAIAEQLEIPTEDESGKPFTVDVLKKRF